jgi:hypothetical protein
MAEATAERAAGRAAFGPEIERLLAEDPHRSGSVDAVLLDQQQRLTFQSQAGLYAAPSDTPPYVPGTRPELEAWVRVVAGDALHPLQIGVALTRFCALVPTRFPTEERSTASGFYGDFSTYLCGGTEEEVIKKGSPLAAERARVLCAMAQVAGLPARIVFLARSAPAERHAVTEIFMQGRWSIFDGCSGRFYAWPKHGYASVWEVQRLPIMVDRAADHGRQRYVDSAYFHNAGIAAYDVGDFASYQYPWDPIPTSLAERLAGGLGA